MFACVIDPFGCLATGIGQAIASIDWWWWAIAALVLVGIVWKLAGWPGIVALGALAGFILGRRSEPFDTTEVPDEDPPHIKRLKQSQRKPDAPKFKDWLRGDE